MSFTALFTWMDLEIIILSKSDRERQISYDITYMWNLKKMIQANLFIKQKLTHKCRKQTYGYKGESWGEINEEFGISICICMLLYIKQTKK